MRQLLFPSFIERLCNITWSFKECRDMRQEISGMGLAGLGLTLDLMGNTLDLH